jgi:hypothetical protein
MASSKNLFSVSLGKEYFVFVLAHVLVDKTLTNFKASNI